ncbi:MAG: hypothetical protein FVQ77_07665 [Cytophagales bacterium]|nr:hypothetical protein [Cytophagales bacterium]
MKTYLTIFALCVLSSLSIAQDPDHKAPARHSQIQQEAGGEVIRIILKDGSVIKDAKLYFIYPDLIEYEKNGSLHDLLINEIDWIVSNKQVIVFDKNNKPHESKRLDLLIDNTSMSSFVSVLSNYVGEDIDKSERDYYWLFPGIKGFISARLNGNRYVVYNQYGYAPYAYTFKIKHISAGSVKDTVITIKYTEQDYLILHFLEFNKILNKEKKVNRRLIKTGLAGSRPIVNQQPVNSPRQATKGETSGKASGQTSMPENKTQTLVRPLRDGASEGRRSDESAAQNKENDNISNKNQPAVITLKNKKAIKDVRLYEIQPNVIVYEKEGSLHDLLIQDIKRIETDKEIIAFDKNNKPLRLQKKPLDAIDYNWQSPRQTTKGKAVGKVSGQTSNDKIDKYVILKISPLALLEPEGSIQGGIELMLDKNISIQQDLGYVFNSYGSELGLFYPEIKQGLISKTELRFYNKNFNKSDLKPSMKRKRNYIAPQFLYKHIQYRGYDYSYRNNKNKDIYAAHLKFGRQFIYKNNTVLDIFLGFGFRHKVDSWTYTYTSYDSWTKKSTTETRNYRNEITLPGISAGFKIGLAL